MPHDGPVGLSRRTVMTAGFLGAASLSLGLTRSNSAPEPQPSQLNNQPNVLVEQVYSQARNRHVDLVTMYPKGHVRQELPVCVMLHGRFGDARNSAAGLPAWLSSAVHEHGLPPFAILTVDGGGNTYWHRRLDDDPMWMLLEELPSWMAERGLGGPRGLPFAVSGVSMGGFGALLYARRRQERDEPLRAVAVVAPALLTSWEQMRKRRAFSSEQEWAEVDPLRHIDALGDVPIGVWCGTHDRFIEGAREFIRRADPEYASTTPGGHNSRYYRKALPELVRFVGRHLKSSTAHE
ncbi:alpha/beta hydrolase [Saccharopolyspora rectivirgula]|jgi:enterochelin esterase-like enzyme|uniref:Esterase n=1 Tax=Saccharopolyspora rectivirgula TaxID=28042 RepID=A0A073AXW2_9PSEU|nr:alpha/beta hydrolase-fold protein [Saccharopolyspora rectivirgula]KEI44136.1 esterase [Saccharopolyspora rectivirgula]